MDHQQTNPDETTNEKPEEKISEQPPKEEIFVLVTDPVDDEPVEIPTDSDGFLPLGTLEHAFPGAYGLKYKNPATGANRVVSFNTSESHFCPPPGGWEGKVFSLIIRPNPPPQQGKVEHEKANKSAVRKRIYEEGEKGEESGGERQGDQEEVEKEEESEGGTGGSKDGEKRQRREKGPGPPKVCSDLIVLGIPFDLEEEALKAYFEQFGELELSEIKRDKNGQSRGFGFIRMADYDKQVEILSIPFHLIGGRECQARISSTDKTVDSFANRSLSVNPKVFIGGLDERVSKDRLKEFFGEHVRRLDRSSSIVDLYYSKPFRNFAFLTLSSSFVAKELVRQHDFVIDGYPCEVTVAVPKKGAGGEVPPDYGPRGGGGSYYGGADAGGGGGAYYSTSSPWNAGGGGGGQPYQQYQQQSGAGGGGYQSARPSAPYGYQQQQRPQQAYTRDHSQLQQQRQPGERDNGNVWANTDVQHHMNNGSVGGGSAIPPGTAEMLLNQLPLLPAKSSLRTLYNSSPMTRDQ